MNMIRIEGSSNISAIGYSPESGELHVRFADGRTYAHQDISAMQYACLMAAPSKGKHYRANFKGGVQVPTADVTAIPATPAYPEETSLAASAGPKETFQPDDCCTKRLIKAERTADVWVCPECGTTWKPRMVENFKHWEAQEEIVILRAGANVAGIRID